MPKLNPYLLSPKKRPEKILELVDPEYPDSVFTMHLRTLRSIDILNIESLVADNEAMYLWGKGTPGKEGYEPPQELPPVGEEVIILSSASVRVISTLQLCQVSYEEEEADIYTFPEIAALMAGSDYIARQISSWYNNTMEEINSRMEEQDKNFPPGTPPTSSDEPS